MDMIYVEILIGVFATFFVIGIVGGVLLAMAVPLRRSPGPRRDGPPPWPRRRG
jgi:hypothetical protein